jgi:hypothetical protein
MKTPFSSGRFGDFMRGPVTCLIPLLALLVACGARATGDDDDDDGPAIDARIDAVTSDADDIDFSKVYAHSGTVLYRLDTGTLQPVEIGPFGLASGSITDIAVDKNDRMLGVSLDNIYTINTTTGAATLIRAYDNDENFTSLSFVPVDLQDPNSAERLVAATDEGTVLEINESTGATTEIGAYGSTVNGLIRSSGDIVAIYGLGIFASVTVGDDLDFSEPDHLAQINPATWAATPLGTGTTYDRIFGIGFWKGKIYGFVDTNTGGAIIELNPNTGAVVGSPITGSVRWFGAGVTTDAPIIGKPGR